MNHRLVSSMSRRSFLSLMGTAAAGTALASCGPLLSRNPDPADVAQVEPVVKPGDLEKPNLTIGYVPVNDCAPFAIAWKKGFFRKYGLTVTLNREASWATSRDGVIFGRTDAAPVVSGAVTNARIGAEGARHAPLCAAMTIHRHGNALTFNRGLWDAGVRPWREYNGNLEAFGQDLRQYFSSLPTDQRVLAVVLSSSIYEYFVRYLTAAAGLDPSRDFRMIVIPPPQMVSNVRIGAMQGYMVAEPWNSRATQPLGKGTEGVGFTFAQGKELWRGHPDRLLGVMESFIEENPKTYRSLVKALIEACQYCGRPENQAEVARIVSERSFTGAKEIFTRPALVGEYHYGGFDGVERIDRTGDSTLFFDLPPGLSDIPGDHSTFLWQSESLWLVTQAARWGQISEIPRDAEALARKAWRSDLYREIAAEMDIPCPAEDYKVEPAQVFIDQKAFDPSDLSGYLNSFEIRASAPQQFGLRTTRL